jgi:hypothetical protein
LNYEFKVHGSAVRKSNNAHPVIVRRLNPAVLEVSQIASNNILDERGWWTFQDGNEFSRGDSSTLKN